MPHNKSAKTTQSMPHNKILQSVQLDTHDSRQKALDVRREQLIAALGDASLNFLLRRTAAAALVGKRTFC